MNAALDTIQDLSQSMRSRVVDERQVDFFIDQLIYCFFLDSLGRVYPVSFKDQIIRCGFDSENLQNLLKSIFAFYCSHLQDTVELRENLFLSTKDVRNIRALTSYDWGSFHVFFFGRVLELEIKKEDRVRLGSFYTPEREVNEILDAVIFNDLYARWTKVKTGTSKEILAFYSEITTLKILDPSCGSGNFLVICLQRLLDLEEDIFHHISGAKYLTRSVSLKQLYGIEKNPRAAYLTFMTLCIYYLRRRSELSLFPNIFEKDAILDLSDPMLPREVQWPEVDYVVGNPPFLAFSRKRTSLGAEYTELLDTIYEGRVAGSCDLSGYWVEKARDLVDRGIVKRVGFVLPLGIRYNSSRDVLDRVVSSAKIFFAVSSRLWAHVVKTSICLIAFSRNEDSVPIKLDGREVDVIHSDLTNNINMSQIKNFKDLKIQCDLGIYFPTEHRFVSNEAFKRLTTLSPSECDHIRPYWGGWDISHWDRDAWIQFLEDEKRSFNFSDRRYLGLAKYAKSFFITFFDSVKVPIDSNIWFNTSDYLYLGILQSKVHYTWVRATCRWRSLDTVGYTVKSCFSVFPIPLAVWEDEDLLISIRDAAKKLDDLRNQWLYPPDLLKRDEWCFRATKDGPWRWYQEAEKDGIIDVVYPRFVPVNSVAEKILRKRNTTTLYNLSPQWLKDAHQELDSLVLRAYGWFPDLSEQEILENLNGLVELRSE